MVRLFCLLLLTLAQLPGQGPPIYLNGSAEPVAHGDIVLVRNDKATFKLVAISDSVKQVLVWIAPFQVAKVEVDVSRGSGSEVEDRMGISDDDDVDGLCGNDCLVGDSLVTTPVGLIPVRDLRAGERVRSGGELTRVRRVHRSQAADLIAVALAGLLSPLQVTAGHRVRTKGGWVRADEVAAGDRVLCDGGRVRQVVSAQRIRYPQLVPVFHLELEHGDQFTADGVVVEAMRSKVQSGPRRREF